MVASLSIAPTARAGVVPAVARYNDPPPPSARTELERRIETLVAEVAAAERRSTPRVDTRLEGASADLVNADSARGGPSNELVEAALRLHGIVEPPPHLIIASGSRGAEQAIVDELRTQLPRALAGGRYTRTAAAVADRDDRVRVVLALQESFVELEPVPRGFPSGGPAMIRGRLLGSFERPTVLVTTPDGKTEALSLVSDAHRFQGTFRCGPRRGRYQIEITGEDRFGSTVLANFPVYCGVPAPATLAAAPPPNEAPVTDAASAEAAVFALINQDRAHAGLRPLAADARLAEIARAHCRDMLAHGFVGHVSPTTGNAADRVARAKVHAMLILENVARAYSPGEVERGLMASPGHRRNILSAEATRVGVGAVLSEALGGARELLVTQVFIAEEAPFRPASSNELWDKLAEFRRAQSLPPFSHDAELDRIADGIARDLASGRLSPESARGPLDRALSGLGARYRSVRSLFAVVTQIGQVAESLKDALAVRDVVPALGVGIAHGPQGGAPGDEGRIAHHTVLILATPR